MKPFSGSAIPEHTSFRKLAFSRVAALMLCIRGRL
jgi:hypothetical protein